MPHGEFCVVSPTDPDPRWPDGYVAVLREAGAKEKNIPYCVGWVRRFFARFPDRRRRDLGRAEIETFLSETAAHPGVSNWQVQQATDALELYDAKFRGLALEPREFVPVAISHALSPASPAQHADAASPSVCIQITPVRYTRPSERVKDEPAEPGGAETGDGASPLPRQASVTGMCRRIGWASSARWIRYEPQHHTPRRASSHRALRSP